jgi:hypothetical protein
MRRLSLVLAALLASAALAEAPKEFALRLSKDDAGKLPAGWKAEKTGKGEGSVWKVVADDTACRSPATPWRRPPRGRAGSSTCASRRTRPSRT